MKLGFWIKFLSGTFIFVVITALSGWLTLIILTSSGDTVIPDLIGQDLTDAMLTLQKKKLQAIVVDKKFHPSIPDGYIISQKPPAGKVKTEYSTVSLIISKGPRKITIPDLSGFSLRQAKIEAERFGFNRIATSFLHHPDYEENEIIAHIPSAGETVFSGEHIRFLVSSGAFPTSYRMKDYIGQSIMDVQTEIEAVANLTFDYKKSETFSSGTIIGQSPKSGEPLMKNQDVTLKVVRNEDEDTGHRLLSYTIPKGFVEREMKVVLVQPEGERVFREETVKPSQNVKMFIPVEDTERIEIYLDDRKVYEELL